MPIRHRLRTADGQVALEAEPDMTTRALRDLVAAATGIPATEQELLAGYPPKALADDAVLTQSESITVNRIAPAAPPADPVAASNGPPPTPTSTPPSAPMAVERKVIPADNNCLFSALIYLLGMDGTPPSALRAVVRDAVLADPDTFSEPVLGAPPAQYGAWICDEQHWGGEIELFVLSKHLGKQIAAFDVVNRRLNRYGEGEGHDQLVAVIYDGIHYDAVHAPAGPGGGRPRTVFGPEDHAAVLAAGHALMEADHKRRKFTDTAKFTLRCLACRAGLVGEKGAQEHAKATGHVNFGEY